LAELVAIEPEWVADRLNPDTWSCGV